MKKETWKAVLGYEKMYDISSVGRLRGHRTFGGRHAEPKILALSEHNGYKLRMLYKAGHKNITAKIHRLVAAAFIPNPENKPTVNHKNGIKTDNRVENLEWATYSENFTHGLVNGLIVPASGENHGRAKLTQEQVNYIRQSYKPFENGATKLSKKFGVSMSAIYRIMNGGSWDMIKAGY